MNDTGTAQVRSRADRNAEVVDRRSQARVQNLSQGRCIGRDRGTREKVFGALALKLTLQRLKPTPFSTPGDIFSDLGEKVCCSHEEGTIFTPGSYQLRNGYSARMGMWITNIFSQCGEHHVGFIHPGRPHFLAGSHIILGEERRLDLIVDSQVAFRKLFEMIDDSKKSFDETVTLEIRNFT